MPLPDGVRRLPLDDLSALAELIGDAHVVAIGENNHYIREFTQLRERILRFLVTELDFGVLAFESGFAEGRLVDDWIRGGPGEVETVARDGFTFGYGDAGEMHDLLGWLRAHNAAGGRVRFAGVDVPGSGGSGVPALSRVREYLAAHGPDQVPLADAAIEAVRCYDAANNGVAPARYAALSVPDRDAATAALTRLLLRLDALPPGPDPREHLIARHHALGALRLDEHLRELVELGTADPPASAISSRDVYQAETVRLLRALSSPGERIVLMVHNAHVQRVPMELLPGVRMRSTGSYLADDLGADYFALGVTARGGSTADMRLDEDARLGIEVLARSLDPPAEDSVERAVEATSPGDEPVLLDLRPARGSTLGPASIRHVHTHVPVDVVTAFDGLACLPKMSPSSFVRGAEAR
ncbi:erythromycin esterase family protein [Amycolatopsis anabasis]|uniref:erythromycin esterase family protein n=1 Tax=Amycolatopsis anabasis TaxID=1840409 RepID=UPI00131E221F|nr:erythromycin esterase family protein [Amycolatopsis anabasis]